MMIIHEVLDFYFDVTQISCISRLTAQDITRTFESMDYSAFMVYLNSGQEIWVTGKKQDVVDGRRKLIELWKEFR